MRQKILLKVALDRAAQRLRRRIGNRRGAWCLSQFGAQFRPADDFLAIERRQPLNQVLKLGLSVRRAARYIGI